MPACDTLSPRWVPLAADRPAGLLSGAWTSPASSCDPHRLLAQPPSARWTDELILACDRTGQPRASLMRSVARGELPAFSDYDPAALGLTDTRAVALLGGRRDFAAGFAFRADTRPDERAYAAEVLLEAATEADEVLSVALYVPHEQAPLFEARAGRRKVLNQGSAIQVRGESFEEHVTHQAKSVREQLRRDQRKLSSSALQVRVNSSPATPARHLELIAQVKARHQVAEHPRLLRMRLLEWLESRPDAVAFEVREGDVLVACCYACPHGGDLELGEIGLDHTSGQISLAYVASMIHAPLEFALERSLDRVTLGLEASRAKLSRGATPHDVFGYVLT